MRNPRPCKVCGAPESYHNPKVYPRSIYVHKERTEPLRAPSAQISERELRKFLNDHIKYAEEIQKVLESERAQGVVSGRLVEARSVLSKFCLEGD